MSKRLVVCCDGTWNKPDQLRDGAPTPTNVSKLALGVSREDSDGIPQLLFYQRGVGTSKFRRVRGGAFGYGLSDNVRACYRFIVESYEAGDELYFFGFSRGAYTARSTAGLIRNSGILRPVHHDRIDDAYSLYRSRKDRDHPSSIDSQIFRRMYSHDDVEIHFVGVWDTVGALGIPIDGLRIPFMDKRWGFHNTDLSRRVRFAYQALAIDEQRGPFKPTLWQQDPQAKDQVLEQVWFAGVHSDVGGGYREQELAEIPLLWMVRRASDCGLAFEPNHFVVVPDAPDAKSRRLGARLAPDPLGPIHESRRRFYRLLPRHRRTLADKHLQSAASSAVRRLREKADYDPASLKAWVDAGRPQTPVQDG
jgi:uncharacterized protein (DUF2235 family)